MSDDEELHARSASWIEQSPRRDNLLADLAAAFAPKFVQTNGHGAEA